MASLRQLTLVIGVTLASMTQGSYAGGFYTGRFGNQQGHAASDHVTSIYFNPAGIVWAKGTHLYLEGVVALRIASYDRASGAIDDLGGTTPNNAESANAGESTLTNVLASPFIGFTTDLGTENFSLGGGLYVPFGGQAKWDQNDEYKGSDEFPGAVDGTQRWANIEGSQRTIYMSAVAAYRFPKANLSIGVGFNVIRNSVETIRARTALGTDDLQTSTGSVLEGRSYLKVDGWTYSLSGGLTWQPTEALRVGVSYQSQPGLGSTRMSGELTNKFGSGNASTTPVWFEQTLPDIARVAAQYRTGKWEFRGQLGWQRWSSFDRQCIMNLNIDDRKCVINDDGSVDTANGGRGVTVVLPRNWKDTFGITLGTSYFFSDRFELFGGGLFDTNAVPDDTLDPALMDMNKVNLMAGMRWQMLDSLRLTFALNSVIYFNRETDPRAIDPSAPSRNPDSAGDYSQFIGYATIGVEALF